jgi:hypothetical protein
MIKTIINFILDHEVQISELIDNVVSWVTFVAALLMLAYFYASFLEITYGGNPLRAIFDN